MVFRFSKFPNKLQKVVASEISYLRGNHSSSKPFFVTTPIFYVNGAPHIGHLQSCMYADAFHRMHRLLGRTTIFSTGTDEHGLKIQQAAKLVGKDPAAYCSEIVEQFKNAFTKADISFTNFIRTTEEQHVVSVHHFWRQLQNSGFIYKGQYEGWYNVSDETFVPPSQIKEVSEPSGKKTVCSETGQILERMQEENYIFALSKFEKDLLYWLSKDVVRPKIFTDDLRRRIGAGLQDLSVSRQRSRLPWGIPVPDDPNHTIYVWLDALVNYLTVGGYPTDNFIWPVDCHIIGKDILKFHGIYWPAFLIAAGMEPPSAIFCHSHWTVDYEKMSKSKGNVVDPSVLIQKYGSDGLRYFLLRAAVPQSDSNYSETKIHRLLNAELADTLGNLLSRCCAPAVNRRQVFPAFTIEGFNDIRNANVEELIESAVRLPGIIHNHFTDGDFYHGIEIIMDCLRKTNAFMQSQKPWELAKLNDFKSCSKLDAILYVALEVLRICGILLQPIVPSTSSCLLDKLGIGAKERRWTDLECFSSYKGLSNDVEERTLANENFVLYARRKA